MIVGREGELQTTDDLVAPPAPGAGVLVFGGEAGIGKTPLWRRAVTRLERDGVGVLPARPAKT